MRKKVKLVAGVGINDYPVPVYEFIYNSDGSRKKVHLKSYTRWSAMINRCYNKSNPMYESYKDVSVCNEWLSFSAFEKWHSDNCIEGMELDKDIWREGVKVYSPETCLFVPKRVNLAVRMRSGSKKNFKIGVCRNGDKYGAKVTSSKGKLYHLGVFASQIEAHKAWQAGKIKALMEISETQKDKRVVDGIVRIASKIQYELDSGLETLKIDSISRVKNQ